MSRKIDTDMARAVMDEYDAMYGQDTPEPTAPETEPEPAKPDVIKLPDLEAPSEWPKALMFSEAYHVTAKDGYVTIPELGEVRDFPTPDFSPEDWPEAARPMIPAGLPPHWVHNLRTAYGIALALFTGDTSLVVGPTGCGKTSALYAACAVHGIPFWVTSIFPGMEDTVLLGCTGLRADEKTGANRTEYIPSQLVLSLMHGGLACLDEAFRASLMGVQSLLEDGHRLVLSDADGLSEAERVLEATPGKWWLFLTDNTTGTGDHTGNYVAEVQDASSLDRILNVIPADYNPMHVEAEIVAKAAPCVPKNTVNDIVQIAALVRQYFKSGGMLQTMSTRAILSVAKKYEVMGTLKPALHAAFVGKLDPDGVAKFGEVYAQVIGEEYDA